MKFGVDEEENVDNNIKVNGIKLKRCGGNICYGIIVVIIFFLIGFMIGYLGYCKGVELKIECERLVGIEFLVREELEEDFFVVFCLYWDDLKKKLLEKLDVIDFISIIKLLNENLYVFCEVGF